MEVPRHWRLKKQRYALEGVICPRCQTPLFPPRPVCPHCAEELRLRSDVQPVGVLVTAPQTVSVE